MKLTIRPHADVAVHNLTDLCKRLDARIGGHSAAMLIFSRGLACWPTLRGGDSLVAGGMKLKALYSAVALILLAGPVGAAQPTSSERASVFAQEEALPKNHAESRSAAGTSAATVDEISAALRAKVRAIIAFLRDDTHDALDDTKTLHSRIRVYCSVRHVTKKPKPSLTAAPALLLEQAASDTAPVTVMLEGCTIKLLQIRSTEPPRPAKRAFSIGLPPAGEDTP
jgi:hypothetical protein